MPLTPKMYEMLLVLIKNRGEVVEKETLLKEVWPDSFVEEGNITFNIRQLRKALDDDAQSPKFIETVPRRGYRFIAEVDEVDLTLEPEPRADVDTPAKPLDPPAVKTASMRWFVPAVAASRSYFWPQLLRDRGICSAKGPNQVSASFLNLLRPKNSPRPASLTPPPYRLTAKALFIQSETACGRAFGSDNFLQRPTLRSSLRSTVDIMRSSFLRTVTHSFSVEVRTHGVDKRISFGCRYAAAFPKSWPPIRKAG